MVIKKRTDTEQKRKNGAKRLGLGACGGILIGVEKKSTFAPIYHLYTIISSEKGSLALRSPKCHYPFK